MSNNMHINYLNSIKLCSSMFKHKYKRILNILKSIHYFNHKNCRFQMKCMINIQLDIRHMCLKQFDNNLIYTNCKNLN